MRLERLFDLAFGVSMIAWGGRALASDPVSAVRIAIAALNLFVGALFLLRRPAEREGSVLQIGMALPAVAVSAVALGLAPSPEAWERGPTILLVSGCSLTIAAFAFLGRSFAVLPAFRGVVARGPYALVRHPAYAGELTMLAGAAWAAGGWIAAAVVPAAVALVALRIRAEEAVLGEAEAYRAYAARVRFRLVPFIW